MKLLELEPVPEKDGEGTGVLNEEATDVGGLADEEGTGEVVPYGDDSDSPEQAGVEEETKRDRASQVRDDHTNVSSEVDGFVEPSVGATIGRPTRGWSRILERLGKFVGFPGFAGDAENDLDDAARRVQEAAPYGDDSDLAEQSEEGTGESVSDGNGCGGVTEPPTQEPRLIDQHGNALAGGPAADVSCELSGSRPSLVTELPTQESWMTDQHGNALAGGPAAPGRAWRIRAEWVMVAIAFLAAGLLGVTAAFSRPYFGADEDPMELPSYHMTATEPEQTLPEPDETEPKNPTIPPDPNPYDRFDFQYERHNYLLLQNVESYPGVDVSAYQGDIDWERVAASGIRFAIVRLGYRGYGSGKLVEDEYAQRNLEGAADAGLQVGAYFFSQALNEQEVDEEIQFLLDVLGEHYLDMPVILDWEIPTADARTAGKMDARSLTDLQLYFCREMEKRGYQPMVYFNWHQSEELYLLSELEEYPFWLALYQDRMTYPWKVEMWQYSCTGRVPGIQGDVDLNVYMP